MRAVCVPLSMQCSGAQARTLLQNPQRHHLHHLLNTKTRTRPLRHLQAAGDARLWSLGHPGITAGA